MDIVNCSFVNYTLEVYLFDLIQRRNEKFNLDTIGYNVGFAI